jgi:hypothetical protein
MWFKLHSKPTQRKQEVFIVLFGLDNGEAYQEVCYDQNAMMESFFKYSKMLEEKQEWIPTKTSLLKYSSILYLRWINQ